MEPQVTSWLLTQGVLGILVLFLAPTVVYLYRAKEKQAEAHRRELDTLMQRHIAKAEAWVEKASEIATRLNAVLEAVSKRGGLPR